MFKQYFEANRRELRNLFFIASLAVCLGLVIFGFLLRNYRAAKIRYEISLLEKQKKELFAALEKVRLNIADKSATGRMHQLYYQKYGNMPLPIGKKIISLKLPGEESTIENQQKANPSTLQEE